MGIGRVWLGGGFVYLISWTGIEGCLVSDITEIMYESGYINGI